MCWIPQPGQLNDLILDCAQKNKNEHLDFYFGWGGEATDTDDEGRNAAHIFAMKGNLEAVAAIADEDMSVFLVLDDHGMSPLMYLADCSRHDVLPFAKKRPQTLAQTDLQGRSVAGFLAAKGAADTVVTDLLPLCPEIIHQKVIAMVMASTHLKPMEKIKAVKVLAAAGFVQASI